MNLLQHKNAVGKTILWSALCAHRALFSRNLSSASALKVAVITGSTRTKGPPVINGPRIAKFITNELEQRGNAVTLVEPSEFSLLEKPEFCYSPSTVPEELKNVKTIFMEADAFVCITPEYNHAPSPGLVNVLNHFGSSVFSFKPSAIVSYSGGQWGGTRAANALRPILSELGALPVSAMIHIPNTQVGSSLNRFPSCIHLHAVQSSCVFRSLLWHLQDNFDEDGIPMEDPQRWQDYCTRSFSQLEWWAEAAKEHKAVSDPFAKSKPFQSSPSQRNAPSQSAREIQ